MSVSPGSPVLCQLIRDHIARSSQHRIPFADFMEMALYHPQQGYYAAHQDQLGMGGDFVTSAHLGTDFGELLADQLAEMWHKLGQPAPFHLVEMGPGQGLLADTLLSHLQTHHPECLAATAYVLIERSPALRVAQQTRLQPWSEQGISLTWSTLADLPSASITGCLFSNELVDAFPVHRVTVTETGLQEQYVTTTGNPDAPFTLTLGPLSTPALSQYFEQTGISLAPSAYPLGYTTEVNLAALEWIATVSQKLAQGYVITIDYGYSADRYYSPARTQGTLQCYTQHAHHDDPCINVGQQDITAHVDFTALEWQGERSGLSPLGTLPQELFLMALGLGDRLTALAQLPGTDRSTLTYALQRREALHQLINPLGLGKFTVLIQGKGLTHPHQTQLKGLTLPPFP